MNDCPICEMERLLLGELKTRHRMAFHYSRTSYGLRMRRHLDRDIERLSRDYELITRNPHHPFEVVTNDVEGQSS